MLNCIAPARRQARFLSGRVIVPTGIQESVWYDVCVGRRQEDQREGMVLLDVGSRRLHTPESCLEFRPAPLSAVRWRRLVSPALARHRLAFAASVAAALVLLGRFSLDR